MAATLARLTALDGIPFNVICNSSDLRAGLEAMGFKFHLNRLTHCEKLFWNIVKMLEFQ